jgi:type III secretion protein Q
MLNPLPAAGFDAQDLQGHVSAEPAAPQPAAEPLLASRELTMRVTFEAGSVSIPLDQLRQVCPGFVFELFKPLDASVIAVLVNGEPVGEGELVCVGDQVGVRLTRVTGPVRGT